MIPLPEACPQPVIAAFPLTLELDAKEVVEVRLGEALLVITVNVERDCDIEVDCSAELLSPSIVIVVLEMTITEYIEVLTTYDEEDELGAYCRLRLDELRVLDE
jgi:hypothetical protein